MRFFFFLLIFSFNTFAQLDTGTGSTGPCTVATFALPPEADGSYHCTTVTIGAPLGPGDLFDASVPLIIRATGAVSITSTIGFEGQAGTQALGAGGSAGPGAGAGGDYIGSADPGQPGTRGGREASSAGICPNGDGLDNDRAEGAGGGGGSLVAAGVDGGDGVIAVDEGIPGTGGNAGTTVVFDINNFTFAGSGGGAGEFGCELSITATEIPGTGGGGGGGIQIISAQDISISGTINVFGGNGGNGVNLGGGGGGGSGGIIVIQTLRQINLTGTLNASAGQGGSGGTTPDAFGGNGAVGIIILQDVDGSVPGGTVIGPTPTIQVVGGSPVSEALPGLKSNISCGLTDNSNRALLFQIAMGFFIALLGQRGIKILSRFPIRF